MRMNIAIEKLNSFKLWWIFFFYTFFVSALVQFVLLPYVFPGLHNGHGLLKSSFDSICFHQLAADLADKIRIQGWSVWQLSPGGQTPAGIASIFYFLILPDPRVLIPFAAALHASAALILVSLINLFVNNKRNAILCVLPFLVFPSNLQWTAQWHRDGISILGIFLVLPGLVLLAGLRDYKNKDWPVINFHSIVFCLSGFILIWIARPYLLTIIDPFVKLFFSILFLLFFIRTLKKEMPRQKALLVFLSILLIIFALGRGKPRSSLVEFKENTLVSDNEEETGVGEEGGKVGEYGAVEIPQLTLAAKIVSGKPSIGKAHASQQKAMAKSISAHPRQQIGGVKIKNLIENDYIENHWQRSFWLPLFIENKAYSLAVYRKGFRLAAPDAKSNIDCDIGFSSVKDILGYLPRAAQIAFLAPFPNQWLRKGSLAANSLMRRVSAFEMIVVYFSLLFLPYAIWHWRKRIEIWIISVFGIYMMLVYGLVVCNIGSLYRLRYAYITILTALGIAGFIALLEQFKLKKDK